MSDFLFFASLRQVFVSVHQVFDDAHHLNNKFPISFFRLIGLLKFCRVLIKTDLAFLFCPCKSFLVFCFVVDSLCHTTDDLHLVNRFYTHSKVFLDECRIDDGSADSHTDGTDLQIGFSSHGRCRNCRTSESQQFLFYIFRNLCIVCFTYIVSVDSECRKSFLCMCSQYGCKVNCSRSLCSVESPYSFDRHRIHIHCLCAVAPAWCNCQCNVNALFFEFVRTCCRFSHTSDRCICNDNFYRLAVCIS